jgi:phosphoribosylformylglycinamidine synthase
MWGYPPELELEREAALQKALVEMSDAELLDSAHDCSEGGLAVALVESSLPANVGFKVDLASQDLPSECVLFGEDASRVVLSCDQMNLSGIQQIAVKYGLSADVIGETVPGQVEIRIDGQIRVAASVSELREIYDSALETMLRTEPELVAAG